MIQGGTEEGDAGSFTLKRTLPRGQALEPVLVDGEVRDLPLRGQASFAAALPGPETRPQNSANAALTAFFQAWQTLSCRPRGTRHQKLAAETGGLTFDLATIIVVDVQHGRATEASGPTEFLPRPVKQDTRTHR